VRHAADVRRTWMRRADIGSERGEKAIGVEMPEGEEYVKRWAGCGGDEAWGDPEAWGRVSRSGELR